MSKIPYIASQFENEFGNLKEEFEVIRYVKLTNDEWVVDRKFNSGRTYFAIEGTLYHRIDNNLFPANMDFDSPTCGACYQIGKIIENRRLITGNHILFSLTSPSGELLKLHRQDYSDGTCFYTLQDGFGQWKSGHASHNVADIIAHMEHEKDIYITRNTDNETDEIRKMYEDVIAWQQDIINHLQEVSANIIIGISKEKWVQLRNSGIGGSDVGSIVGLSQCKVVE